MLVSCTSCEVLSISVGLKHWDDDSSPLKGEIELFGSVINQLLVGEEKKKEPWKKMKSVPSQDRSFSFSIIPVSINLRQTASSQWAPEGLTRDDKYWSKYHSSSAQNLVITRFFPLKAWQISICIFCFITMSCLCTLCNTQHVVVIFWFKPQILHFSKIFGWSSRLPPCG